MEATITNEVLAGVGKKLRNGYLAGTVPASKVFENYNMNVREVSGFSFIGLSILDLKLIERETHNPLLRNKVNEQIELHKRNSLLSNNHNKVSLEKLEEFKQKALGIGLRKVLASMKRMVKHSDDLEANIVLTLLETEYANLTAKKNHSKKKVIYERKGILLEKLSYMLSETNWRYGISYNPGKNASYIIYVYLPDGTQLSWHCNDYNMVYCYPEIVCEWDGMPCMTMEKILGYINKSFHVGNNN